MRFAETKEYCKKSRCSLSFLSLLHRHHVIRNSFMNYSMKKNFPKADEVQKSVLSDYKITSAL